MNYNNSEIRKFSFELLKNDSDIFGQKREANVL